MMQRGTDVWKHDKDKVIVFLHSTKYGDCTVRSDWWKNLPFVWPKSSLGFKERWENAAQRLLHLGQWNFWINSLHFIQVTCLSNRWLKVIGRKIGDSVWLCSWGSKYRKWVTSSNIKQRCLSISQKVVFIRRLCSHSASWHRSPRHLLSILSCHCGRIFLCSLLFWHSYGACLWLASLFKLQICVQHHSWALLLPELIRVLQVTAFMKMFLLFCTNYPIPWLLALTLLSALSPKALRHSEDRLSVQ